MTRIGREVATKNTKSAFNAAALLGQGVDAGSARRGRRFGFRLVGHSEVLLAGMRDGFRFFLGAGGGAQVQGWSVVAAIWGGE